MPDILSAVRADLWSSGFIYDSHKGLLDEIESSGNIFNKKLVPPSATGEKTALLGCRFLEREEDANKYLNILEKLNVNTKTYDEICCGMPFAVLGDRQGFKHHQNKFMESVPDKNDKIICVCTTCELNLRNAAQKQNNGIHVKNVLDLVAEAMI